jgi:peptide/nickel transport system substrate-binding protein
MAERTIGPIHPSKAHYNKSLPLKEHDLEKAKALLSEAGWKDSDGDGLLDKVINGKKTPLRVNYKYNSENNIRKNIGILLQSQAKPLGIEVVLDGKEWSQFLKETKNRNFDMICLGWSQSPGLDEMKQIWHTSSDTPDGSNYTGFGNKETDKIIDSIRITLDPAKRQELYNRMQEIIYNEQPYVFLAVPKERIAIHKRFDNVVTTSVRPGFKESQFKLK